MLNYAVDVLAALPNVTTYLDGTHSAWLGAGDIAHRLAQAGVADADGFYLNVSNYHFTSNNTQYGRWISSCLAYAAEVVLDDFFNCPNQYWNGGPLPAKIAVLLGEWTGVALSWLRRVERRVRRPGAQHARGSTSDTAPCSAPSSRRPTS